MMKQLILLLALLVASPAWSGVWSKGCQFNGGDLAGTLPTSGVNPTDKRIGNGNIGCLRFVAAETAAAPILVGGNTLYVTVAATSAVITFDPRLDAAGATTAQITPYMCPQGVALTAANPEQSCIAIGGAGANDFLDGTEGSSSNQNAAIRVGPGVYFFWLTADCAAGDTCQITIKGEGGSDH